MQSKQTGHEGERRAITIGQWPRHRGTPCDWRQSDSLPDTAPEDEARDRATGPPAQPADVGRERFVKRPRPFYSDAASKYIRNTLRRADRGDRAKHRAAACREAG